MAWNGGFTSFTSVAGMLSVAASARSFEQLGAPKRLATGRERRRDIALALGGGQFSQLDMVSATTAGRRLFCWVQRLAFNGGRDFGRQWQVMAGVAGQSKSGKSSRNAR